MSTFWISANELPLTDELVPFLVARTGQSLDAFVRWVKTRRRVEEARKSLRGVLDARSFVLAADDQARIDACDVTDTLERWLKQSVVASSVAEALR